MSLDPNDYQFCFPDELIATAPCENRSDSQLFVFHRNSQKIEHRRFYELSESLRPDDLMVLNETYVLPSRFFATKSTGGQLEGLWVGNDRGQAKVWLQGRVQPGDQIFLKGCQRSLDVLTKKNKEVVLSITEQELKHYLWKKGGVPLPPYIRKQRKVEGRADEIETDKSQYQTFFANRNAGLSKAAPTASLHFDERVFSTLQTKGIEICKISLEVGMGTFAPLEREQMEQKRLHRERVHIDQQTWQKITEAKQSGRRIVGVGTTVVRSLESAALLENFQEDFETELFIQPGFEFKVVDVMQTNFHQPMTSLIMLVASFIEPGHPAPQKWKELYRQAVSHRYRLFSYGDAMLII